MTTPNSPSSTTRITHILDSILTAPIRNLFALVGVYEPWQRGLVSAVIYAFLVWWRKPARVFNPDGSMRSWALIEDVDQLMKPDSEPASPSSPDSVYMPVYIEIYAIGLFVTCFT